MLLQALSGVALLINLVLCIWIAMRILARTRGPGFFPERWLAVHLILYWCVAGTLSSVLYSGWSDPNFALPELATRVLHAASFATTVPGSIAAYCFTQRTFRADVTAARNVVYFAAIVLIVASLGVGYSEGFELRVVNGPAYWTVWTLKSGVFVWLAVESFAYWRQLRKRLALGLAKPLLVNRFFVWGCWAATASALSLVEPGSRLAYLLAGGEVAVWDPAIGKPIIELVLATVFVPQYLMCGALFLTFFPTRGYRRWIEKRAAGCDSTVQASR